MAVSVLEIESMKGESKNIQNTACLMSLYYLSQEGESSFKLREEWWMLSCKAHEIVNTSILNYFNGGYFSFVCIFLYTNQIQKKSGNASQNILQTQDNMKLNAFITKGQETPGKKTISIT